MPTATAKAPAAAPKLSSAIASAAPRGSSNGGATSAVASEGASALSGPQLERVVRALHAAGLLPTAEAVGRAATALEPLASSALPRASLAALAAAASPPPALAHSSPVATAPHAKEALARTLAHLEGRAARPLAFELQQVLVDCTDAERFGAWAPLPTEQAIVDEPSSAHEGIPAAVPAVGSSTTVASSVVSAARLGKRRGVAHEKSWWSAALESDGSSDAGSDDVGGDEGDDERHDADAMASSTHGGADGIDEAMLDGISEPLRYESPLLALRSYRLSAGYLDGGQRQLTGSHSRARLHPSLPLCRFELNGECRALDCTGQHRARYLPPAEQVPTDLRRYAASLPSATPPAADDSAAVVANAFPPVPLEERIARETAIRIAATYHAAGASSDALAPRGLVLAAAQSAVDRKRESSAQPNKDGDDGPSTTAPASASTAPEGIFASGFEGGVTTGRGARVVEAARLQLLHAAIRVNPQPSLLAGDLTKNLQPTLARYRSADAAALEASALDGAPPPSGALQRGPTQDLLPSVPFAPLSSEETAQLATATAASGGAHGGGGGGERYWARTAGEEASLDDTSLAVQLSELGDAACWRRVLTLRLGGDARAAGPARRRSARRVLSRCLESRASSVALWVALLAVHGVDATAAELKEQLGQAVRHAPSSLLLWGKLAALQPTLSGRFSTRVRALHMLVGEVERKCCAKGALLPAAIALLKELAAARLHSLAEHVADVMLASDAEAAAESRALAQEAAERSSGVGKLPPIPRVGPLLPPAALGVLWLARVELLLATQLAAASAAADELLLAGARPPHAAWARSDDGAGEPTDPFARETGGCMLPWMSWARLDGSADSVRALLNEALRAVSAQVVSSAAHVDGDGDVGGGAATPRASEKSPGIGTVVGTPAADAAADPAADLSTAAPRLSSNGPSRATGETRTASLWLLRLNLVGLELALEDSPAADAACRAFLADDFGHAGGRCERTWRLWARVQRALPSGSDASSDLGGAARARESLIWQARLSEQPSPLEAGNGGGAKRAGRVASETCRFELWHALLLSSSRSRNHAMRLAACALSERHPPRCEAVAASVYKSCKPTPRPVGARVLVAVVDEATSVPLGADIIVQVTALLRAWLEAAAGWDATRVREATYVCLLGALWMQMTAGSADVQSIFEAGLRIAASHAAGGCRAALWLRYLAWCHQPSSGVSEGSMLKLVRRCLERRDKQRGVHAMPTSQPSMRAPPARHAASSAARAPLTVVAPPVVQHAERRSAPYDECDDAQVLAILCTEPARSFFHGCGPGLAGGGSAGGGLARMLGHATLGREGAQAWGEEGHAPWVWEAEAHALAVHMALRRATSPRRWELGSSRALPPALMHVAARAARAGAMRQARTALAAALQHAPRNEEVWPLAIWVEAADEHWEAAATLAHIAVANHHGSATLWQQAAVAPLWPWGLLARMRSCIYRHAHAFACARAAAWRLACRDPPTSELAMRCSPPCGLCACVCLRSGSSSKRCAGTSSPPSVFVPLPRRQGFGERQWSSSTRAGCPIR